MMTYSPWTSGSTRLGGTLGIKSSVRQGSTLEFADKEEEQESNFKKSAVNAKQAHKIWLTNIYSRDTG